MQKAKSTLPALASVLRASPATDTLDILGRLLDSLPIGFHVSDCGGGFHILYANRAWQHWLGPEKLPVADDFRLPTSRGDARPQTSLRMALQDRHYYRRFGAAFRLVD